MDSCLASVVQMAQCGADGVLRGWLLAKLLTRFPRCLTTQKASCKVRSHVYT